jgi:hypothetical protein
MEPARAHLLRADPGPSCPIGANNNYKENLMKPRILAILSALLLTAGLSAGLTASPGLAQPYQLKAQHDPYELCNPDSSPTQCLNNWNNGPAVESYGPDTTNDAFGTYVDTYRCNDGHTTSSCPIKGNPSGLQIVQVHNEDPNSLYYGQCVGDANNSPTNARAYDNDACDNGGANGGWGTVFVYYPDSCPDNGIGYVNVHWNSTWSTLAGIGWAGNGYGYQAYLNTVTAFCLVTLQFAEPSAPIHDVS